MSILAQLEELQRRKAELQNELRSLQEKKKILGAQEHLLEEKLAIQELEGKVRAGRSIVEQLEAKIVDLERRLKEPQRKEPGDAMARIGAPRQSPS